MSGLDAGQIYQSWPLMNHNYFPDDSSLKDLFSLNSFNTPSLVQFIHRNMAYLILFFFFIIAIKIFRNNDFIYMRKTMFLVFVSTIWLQKSKQAKILQLSLLAVKTKTDEPFSFNEMKTWKL